MEFIKEHLADIIIVIIIAICFIAALIYIRKKKGKCAYCDHQDTCPFKNRIKKDS